MVRVAGVKDWWLSRLRAQGMPDDEAEEIARWVEVEDTVFSLYDIVYKRRSAAVGSGREVELREVRTRKEREKRLVEDSYQKKRAAATEKAKKGKAEKDADITKSLEEEYKNKIAEIEARYAGEEKAVLRSWEGRVEEVDFWPAVRAYIRCIAPDAEVDKYHFYNVCPVCNYRDRAVFDGKAEYNQVCSNCGVILSAQYVCVCPLCNSGLSKPMREGGSFDPLFEFLPRAYAVYEDIDHYPPFPEPGKAVERPAKRKGRRAGPDDDEGDMDEYMRGLDTGPSVTKLGWKESYTRFTDPEYRYHMVCPLCLYEWYIVFWFPERFGDKDRLCVCGELMRSVSGKREEGVPEGAVFFECTNPKCREGRLKNWG